jgi:hypothetical protein
MDQSISIVGVDGKGCSSSNEGSNENVQSTTSPYFYGTTTMGLGYCPNHCLKDYCSISTADSVSCISEQEPRCYNNAAGSQQYSEGKCWNDDSAECQGYPGCYYWMSCSYINGQRPSSVCGLQMPG